MKLFNIFVKFLFLVSLGLSIPAWAQPSVEAHVDKRVVALDDTLELTVTVRGSDMGTTPDIPPLGHFDVIGRSVGTSIEVINGRLTSTKTFQYQLSPRQTGEFSIGPIKVYIEGNQYTAGPLTVTVAERAAPQNYRHLPGFPGSPPLGQPFPFPRRPWPSIPGMPGPQMPGPPPGYPQEPTQPPAETRDTFLTVETDRKEAYVGQQVLFTFRLYSAVSVQGAQLSLPDFKDFITEELAKERKYQVDLGGRRYMVNEWRMALFPTKAGRLETGKTEVKANVPVSLGNPFNDPFFQGTGVSYRPKTFSGESLAVEVKLLPPAPADFTGLVGQFNLVSQLSKDQLDLGETANWKIELSGKGNIREAILPKIENPPNFKIYPDQPATRLDKSLTGLEGKKTFNYALVAERPGTVTLPALQMSFFNPDTGQYDRLNTPPATIAIKGTATQEKLVSAGLQAGSSKPAAPAIRDLQPIEEVGEVLRDQSLVPWQVGMAWTVFLGSPFTYLLYLFTAKYKEHYSAHAEDRKRSRAFRKAKQALMKLHAPTEGQDFSAISGVVREYLGDRLSVAGKALTPLEIEELLKKKGITAEGNRKLIYLLEQLDQWQYGGIRGTLPPEKELKHEILDILRGIEREV